MNYLRIAFFISRFFCLFLLQCYNTKISLGFYFWYGFLKHCKALSTEKYQRHVNSIIIIIIIIIIFIIVIKKTTKEKQNLKQRKLQYSGMKSGVTQRNLKEPNRT